jgi:hypothetical protein
MIYTFFLKGIVSLILHDQNREGKIHVATVKDSSSNFGGENILKMMLPTSKIKKIRVNEYSLLTRSASCSEACPFCKRFLSLSLDLHSSLVQPFCAIQEPERNNGISKKRKVLNTVSNILMQVACLTS